MGKYDVLKQYKIQIGADTAEFLKELASLETEANKKLKDLNLSEGMRNDMEKLVQEIGTMKKSLSNATDEVKNNFKSISSSVGDLSQKMDDLQSAIALLNSDSISKSTKNMSDSFNKLSDNITEIIGKFKDISEVIQNIQLGKIDISVFDNMSKDINKTKKNVKKDITDLEKYLENLSDYTVDFNINLLDEKSLKKKEKSVLTELRAFIDVVENEVKSLGGSAEAKNAIVEHLNMGFGDLKNAKSKITEAIDVLNGEIKSNMPKNIDTEVRFKINLDEDVKGTATVKSIIDKVNEVVEEAQKKINPIKISIGYKNDTSDIDEKDKIELEKAKKDNYLYKKLKVDVQADTKTLVDQINSEVEKVNKELKTSGKKIEVEVIGKVNPDTIEESKENIAYEVEDAQYKLRNNIKVNGGNLSIDSSSGIATETTLSDIRSILSQWNTTGIPGTQSKEFKEQLKNKVNNALVASDFDKLFRNRFKNKHLTDEAKGVNDATASFLRDLYANMATKEELTKLIKSSVLKKGGEEGRKFLQESDYYKKYFEFEGQKYAKFAPGKMLLTEWQSKLDKLFDASFDPDSRESLFNVNKKFVPKLDDQGKKITDEQGNVLTEEIQIKSALRARREAIDKDNKRLRENLKLNGVEFKKEMKQQKDGSYKWTGSYTTEILNEKGTITSNEDPYAKAKNSTTAIKEAAKKEYEYQVAKKQELEEQRSIMKQIFDLEQRQASGSILSENDIKLLSELKNKLEPNAIEISDRQKYEELTARKNELIQQAKTSGLGTKGLLEINSIDEQIDSLFVKTQDLSKYVIDQLKVDAETGFSVIDSRIEETEKEMKAVVESAQKEISEVANNFNNYFQQNAMESLADGSLDKKLYKQNRRIRDHYDNIYETDVVKNQAHYDWNEKEIARLKKENSYFEKFITQRKDKQGRSSIDTSALGKEDKEIYYRNQQRIKQLQTQNRLYADQHDLVEELTNAKKKESKVEGRTKISLHVPDSEKEGYEKLWYQMTRSEVYNQKDKNIDTTGFIKNLSDEDLLQALSSLKQVNNAIEKKRNLTDKEIEVLVQSELQDYANFLKKTLEQEEKNLESMLKKGASKKQINRKEKRIANLTASIDSIENPQANYAQQLEEARQKLRDVNKEQEELTSNIREKLNLTDADIEKVKKLYSLQKTMNEEEINLQNANINAYNYYKNRDDGKDYALVYSDGLENQPEIFEDRVLEQLKETRSARSAYIEYKKTLEQSDKKLLQIVEQDTAGSALLTQAILESDKNSQELKNKIFDIQARSHGFNNKDKEKRHKAFRSSLGGKEFDPFDTSLDQENIYEKRKAVLTEKYKNKDKSTIDTARELLEVAQQEVVAREKSKQELIERHEVEKKIVKERQKEIDLSYKKQKEQNIDPYNDSIAEKTANVEKIKNEIVDLQDKSSQLQKTIDETSSESEHAFLDLRKEEEKIFNLRLERSKKLQTIDSKIDFNKKLLQTKDTKTKNESDEEYSIRINDKINKLEEEKIRLKKNDNELTEKENISLDNILKKREKLISTYGKNVYSMSMDDIDKELATRLASKSNSYLLDEDKIYKAQSQRLEHIAKAQNKLDVLKTNPVYNTRQQALVGLEKELNALRSENVRLVQEEELLLKNTTDSRIKQNLEDEIFAKRLERNNKIRQKEIDLQVAERSHSKYKQENARLVLDLEEKIRSAKEEDVRLTQQENEALKQTKLNYKERQKLEDSINENRNQRKKNIVNYENDLQIAKRYKTKYKDPNKESILTAESELNDLKENNDKLNVLEERRLKQINFETQTKLSLEKEIAETVQEKSSVDKEILDVGLLKQNAESQLNVEKNAKEAAEERLKINKEIKQFQKGMSKDQKRASLGVDLQLLSINEMKKEQQTLSSTSDRYKELSKEISKAYSQLELFRQEAKETGLTLSETTGRMYLGEKNKDFGLLDISFNKEHQKYQTPSYNAKDQIEEQNRFNDAKFKEYEYHSKIVDKVKEENEVFKRMQTMWRTAGMSDEQAEIALKIKDVVSHTKNWNSLSEKQKNFLQSLYKEARKLGLELKYDSKIAEKAYVKEKVDYQTFAQNPEQYATNKYLRGMMLNPNATKYDMNYIENYRGATESTLQNIQNILKTGINVKVLDWKNKINYKKSGLHSLPNIDADKPAYKIKTNYSSYNGGIDVEALLKKEKKTRKDWNSLIKQAKSEEEKNKYRTQALETGKFALNKNKNVVSLDDKNNKNKTNKEVIAATKEYIEAQKLAIKTEDLFAGKVKEASKNLDEKANKTKKNVKVSTSNNLFELQSILNKKDSKPEEKQNVLDEILSRGYQLGWNTKNKTYYAGDTKNTSAEITKKYAEENGLVIKSLEEIQNKAKETTNVVRTEIDKQTEIVDGGVSTNTNQSIVDLSSSHSKELAKSYLDGVKASTPEMEKAFEEFALIPENVLRAALGIESPSKVMEQLGYWTVNGFAKGVKDNSEDIKKALIQAFTDAKVSQSDLANWLGLDETKSLIGKQGNNAIYKVIKDISSNNLLPDSYKTEQSSMLSLSKAKQFVKDADIKIDLEELKSLGTKVGRQWQISKDAIIEYIEKQKEAIELQEKLNDSTEEYKDIQKIAHDNGLSGALDIIKTTSVKRNKNGKETNVLYNVKDAYGNSAAINAYGNVESKEIKKSREIVSKEATELKKLMSQIESTLGNNAVQEIRSYMDALLPDGEKEKVEELKNAYSSLLNVLDSFKNGKSDFTEEELNFVKNQINTINTIKSSFTGETISLGKVDISSPKELQSALKGLAKEFEDVSISHVKFSKNNKEMTYQLVDGNKMLNTYKLTVKNTGEVVRDLVKSEKHLNIFQKIFAGFTDKFAELFRYTLATISIHDVVRYLREGITVVREYDAAMTELYKVSNDTKEALDKFGQEAYDVAKKIGSTGVEIINSAADWTKLGYAINEASELAKNSALYANVGDMDIDTATEHMVSTLKAFNVEAEDSISIVDKFNEIGNNYAISSAGIGEALERSASSLVAAGNDIDQAIALITAGNVVSQDPESVGNAIKVLSLRIRGSKTELEAMGEETDGLASSTSKLRSELKELTGVDIMLDNNTYKDTYTILLEISKVWDQLSDVSQANVLEKLAGKTRASVVAGLLQQGETLEDVYNDSRNAAGSATKENEKYLNSIQGHLDLLTNQWQSIWTSELTRDVVNTFLDIGTSVLKLVDDFGLLKTVITGAFTIFAGKNLVKNSGGRDKKFSLVIKYATESFSREVCEF